jgi:hypothetical protein
MRVCRCLIGLCVFGLLALAVPGSGRAVAQEIKWESTPDGIFSGLPVTLAPVGDLKKDKFPDANKVWGELLKDMAKDVESQKLLKKLLGCKELEIVVADKPPKEGFKPPQAKSKSAIYLFFYQTAGTPGTDDLKGCHLASLTYYGYATAPTRQWKEDKGDLVAIKLAINEFLVRKKINYYLHHPLLFDIDDLPAAVRDPEKRPAFVEGEIKKFLDAYK